MIVCVTPNVAIDRTLIVAGYGKGGVFRPQETIVAPGGKGINVARAIKIIGGEPLCAGYLGGFSGKYVAHLIEQEGFANHWTWLEHGETRTCIILVDPEKQETSVINESGPHISENDWSQLEQDLQYLASSSKLMCFCGSLPPGTVPDRFTRMLQKLEQAGVQIWVDTSGQALEIAAQTQSIHLKINDDEAGKLLDCKITSVNEAKEAAYTLQDSTKASVVITLAAAGAVMVSDARCWHARPPAIDIVSAVGSGDSFLAGFLTAIEKSLSAGDALKYGAAAGAANALSVGGARFEKSSFESLLSRIELQEL